MSMMLSAPPGAGVDKPLRIHSGSLKDPSSCGCTVESSELGSVRIGGVVSNSKPAF
jgi:hypothetical protein